MKTAIKTVRSFGPVTRPESYVNPEWWRHIFNALYLKTDGDVVDDENITRHETRLFIKLLQLKKENTILDICCGQGRHCSEFYKRGFTNVEGIDRSAFLVAKARNKSKLNGYKIVFKEGDARNLQYPPDSFDVVTILGNSFGYFQHTADDIRVLQSAFKILKPGGKILIDIADGSFLKHKFVPRSWEWINNNYFVCRERSLSANKKKLISREVITHTRKGVIADQFYAENLYTENEIKFLLQQAAFTNIILHSSLKVNSIRDQDLGMMENRIILTAIKLKKH
jgi:D-alanine-D-alanine ligase